MSCRSRCKIVSKTKKRSTLNVGMYNCIKIEIEYANVLCITMLVLCTYIQRNSDNKNKIVGYTTFTRT